MVNLANLDLRLEIYHEIETNQQIYSNPIVIYCLHKRNILFNPKTCQILNKKNKKVQLYLRKSLKHNSGGFFLQL